MGSKKRSPQPTDAAAVAGSPAAGEVPGHVGAPPAGKGPAAAPVAVVPKPPDVAPFLTKVYDMVSDPATDSVISWGPGGGSFVIWDSHAFERDLLPRHFKHNHFTSFIRQLNTYGFHKVDPDRWEWANEGFVKDQKHLLKTIKRKKKTSQETHDLPQAPVKTAPGTENIEIGNYGGLEKEVETLKRDKTLLMQQLVDLRHYQQSSSLELQNLIQRLHVMEQNQQQMMALLAIVVQNPDFLNQLVQQQRRTTWWNDDESKKRRFIALEHGPAAEQETSGAGAPIIQYRPPVPEISNQAIPVNDAFCSTPVQPVSSPAVAVPMDAEMASKNVDTLGSTEEQFTGASGLCDWDDVDMDALFNDLDSMDTSVENDGQMEVPLSVDDYQQLERDCQMEAQQNCRTPQYGQTMHLMHKLEEVFGIQNKIESFSLLSLCHVAFYPSVVTNFDLLFQLMSLLKLDCMSHPDTQYCYNISFVRSIVIAIEPQEGSQLDHLLQLEERRRWTCSEIWCTKKDSYTC